MRRILVVAIVVLCGGGALTPALAQKRPPEITRDTDRDGVPDVRDRCPNTALGARVDVNGCPIANAPGQPNQPATAQAPNAPGAIAPQAAAPGNAPANPARPGGAPTGFATPVTGAPASAAAPTAAAKPAGAAAPAPGAQPAGTQPAGNTAAAPAPAHPAGAPAPAAGAPPSGAPAGASAAAPTSGAQPAGAAAAPTGAAPVTGAPANAAVPAPTPVATAAPAAPAGPPVVRAPAPTAPPGAAAPGAAAQPAGAAAPPRAAAPSAAPSAAAADPTLTAGFLMQGWVPGGGRSATDFARSFVVRLDSAAWALRNMFATSSGQPIAGATDPNKLSTRERQRWRNCRNMKEDIQTFSDNVPLLLNDLPDPLRDSWSAMGDKFDELQQVLEQCETLAFMIDSPERYTPWERNYDDAARAFYADWYGKLRALHEAMRAAVRFLNTQLPADRRLPLFPTLPVSSPTPGGR